MKKLLFSIITLFVFSIMFAASASANTVSPDPTFNGTGYSIRPAIPLPDWSIGRALAVQPDGKIVIAGDTVSDDQTTRKFAVMRLNADGTLDGSFGSGGSVATIVDRTNGLGDLALQPDGKVLLCGYSYSETTTDNFTLVRYTSAGALDTTFNGVGYRALDINGASHDYCTALAVLPDGKILAVGNTATGVNTPRDTLLTRFNADGSLDTTFNGTGFMTVGSPSFDEAPESLILLPDGKFIIGGYQHNGVKYNFMLMRFNADGTTDTSFGTNGTTITSVTSGGDILSAMDRQANGKIIAVGNNRIVRYSANGVIDTSFGTNGVAVVPPLNETSNVRVTGDDKILVAGRGVSRFTKDGWLDTNFNDGGYRSMQALNLTCITEDVNLQPDGKLLLGGYCSQNSIPQFAVFRFLPENRTKRFLDFSGDGGTDLSLFRPSTGQWLYQNSATLQTSVATFGTATDRLVPADYTGDGRADIAVFRPSTGEWYILRSENGTFYSIRFGASGDVPVQADYDGDQTDDVGVFRPSTGNWFIQLSSSGTIITHFGLPDDLPVASDYDGDFKTDVAVYRPSTGEWWINKSSDASVYAFQFGSSTDKPVAGDYTGDGKTDAAFWRPSTGEWFILRSEDSSYYSIPFGLSDDLPTPGNFSGDARFDLAVFRPSTNTWHFLPTGGSYFYKVFGAAGDRPVPNVFVP